MKPITEIIGDKGGLIKTSELGSRTEYKRLLRAVHRGEVVRVRHGVYAMASSLVSTMIDVERIIPNGVICLYNAWAYHQLSTTVPSAFCVAIEAKRKINIGKTIPINLYYWKKDYLDFGISYYSISGYNVKMTDLERSVCDAVKYRNKVGLDVCAEVVRSYIRKDERNISRLMEYAKKLRVSTVMSNYLEISLQ